MIIQKIIDILQTEGTVYINDLGLFSKCFKSAQLKNGILFPPGNIVIFDSKADGNGFAFVVKYAEKLQKRIPEADEEIKKWVEELKSAVEHNKSVSFENFGTFLKNSKEELCFESDLIKELNSEYEGMSPIEINPADKTEITKPVEKILSEEPAVAVTPTLEKQLINKSEITPAPEIETPSVSTNEIIPEQVAESQFKDDFKEDKKEEFKAEPESILNEEIISTEKNRKKSHTGIVIFIIIMIILAGVAALSYFYQVQIELTYKDLKNRYFEKGKVISEPDFLQDITSGLFEFKENKDSSKIEIITPYSIDYQLENKIEQIPADEITAKSENSISLIETRPSSTEYERADFQSGFYYVIAGSFIAERDAAIHIKGHGLQHHNPFLLYQSGNNRIRVCIGVFSTEQEANEFVKKQNENYWVLK